VYTFPSKEKALKKELKKLAEYQSQDSFTCKISNELANDPHKYPNKYMLRENVMLFKDARKYPYCRVVLPKALEIPIIDYVHNELGH
jgi:hypothetical protein